MERLQEPEKVASGGVAMNQELIGRLASQHHRLLIELTPENPSGRGGMGSEDPAEREERLQRQIRHLKKVLEELPQLGPAMLHRDRVGFGSEVRLEDLRSGKVLSYTIMTGDSIDIDTGEVS